MKNSFFLQQMSNFGNLDFNLISRQYNLQTRLLEDFVNFADATKKQNFSKINIVFCCYYVFVFIFYFN